MFRLLCFLSLVLPRIGFGVVVLAPASDKPTSMSVMNYHNGPMSWCPFNTAATLDAQMALVLAFAVQAVTKLPSIPWLARNRVVMLAVPVSCIVRTRLLDPVAENFE
ncbi:hypothetical protein BC826DRAFT_1079628 [Russula brevipes]|nr:hypothetical protein BC826DRAFT_1079628 [Russula brevipes]